MEKLKAVILAAGKGTRMESDLPKVIHTIDGKPMVEYVISAVKEAGVQEICLIVGYKSEEVKSAVTSQVSYVFQAEQLGTGHAVKCASDFIGESGDVLVLCGDTPLITGKTLKEAIDYHKESQDKMTVISAIVDDPTGYGRIIRDENNEFLKNVEHKDATEEERKSKEVNSGMYIFSAKDLNNALGKINNDNVQGEYYLPDTLEIIKKEGGKVGAYILEDSDEMAGVNTKAQLQAAADIMAKRRG